ncbi:hypothetical protein T265_11393 [Opisthorchis viverrini]|uniref:Uncharacterized protein n=1 Tax=Opisthorchis viverrini TaxID=6198 RepID=A0A074Z9M3_OPIVI|nr:hypothetical protein T265_11393 [Opisthorchis viverrini]KER19945.1 hypothetical protein T265_11393 [Opisthorchis viverrini]
MPESNKAYIVLDQQHFQLENIDKQCSLELAYEMTTVLNPSGTFRILVSVLRLGLLTTYEQYRKIEEPLFMARGVTRFGLSTFDDVPMEMSSFLDYETFRLKYFNFFDDSPTLSISHFSNALKSITDYFQHRYELVYLHTSYTTMFRRCSKTDQEFPELIVYIQGCLVPTDFKNQLASLLDETSEVYQQTLGSVYKSLSDTMRAWKLEDCVSSLIVDPFMRKSEQYLTAIGHIGFDFIHLMKKIPNLFKENNLEKFVETYSKKPTVGIYKFRMKGNQV